jgi:hypothetical protein
MVAELPDIFDVISGPLVLDLKNGSFGFGVGGFIPLDSSVDYESSLFRIALRGLNDILTV